MAHSFRKRIAEIIRTRDKYTARGDFAEAARLCNAAGELCSANGAFEDACEYHKEEVRYSEIINDRIGEAVGHRKIGECLCQLDDFKGALSHQRKHLSYAKESGNLTEEQRALATIGRTFYLQSESMDYPEHTLMEAQKAYLESLEVCDKLKSIVSEKELLEMRCRLYLNLGLVYEFKQELEEAVRFVKKALVTSSEFQLKETMYRCFLSLSCILAKQDKNSEALQYARKAQHISKDMCDHSLEADAWVQLGQMLLSLGNFTGCKEAFKKAYTLSQSIINSESETILRGFKLALEGDDLLSSLEGNQSLGEKMKLYEKLGDIYSECKSLGLAIACYKKQLELAMELNSDETVCGAIYISLGVTYSENRCYDKALECYEEELKLRAGEARENADTYCAIAKVQEDSGFDFDVVKDSYLKAIKCAKQSGKASVLQKVYKEYLDTLITNNETVEASDIEREIKLSSSPGKDDDSQSQEIETEIDWQVESSRLLKLLEDVGDESDDADDDMEVTEIIPGKRKGTHNRKSSKRKYKKVNAKGETPLHTACISGHLQEVKALLQTGADVQARDYCGWQPLHEAANHGHDGIVAVLLDAGACIDDPGGQHCHGITPLHDAAQNGHLSTVQLLIARGANVHVRDACNNSPIDLVVSALKAQEEEEVQESEMMRDRREVLAFLKSVSKDPPPRVSEIRRRDTLLTKEENCKQLDPPNIHSDKSRNQCNVEPFLAMDSEDPEPISEVTENTNDFPDDLFSMELESDSDSNYASMDDEDHCRESKRSCKRSRTPVTERVSVIDIPDAEDSFQNLPIHNTSNRHSRIDNLYAGRGKDVKSPFYSTSNRRKSTLDTFIVDDLNLGNTIKRNRNTIQTGTTKRKSMTQSKITGSKTNKKSSSFDKRGNKDARTYASASSSTTSTGMQQTSRSSNFIPPVDISPERNFTLSSDPGKIMRVRVKIEDQTLLVPCRGDAKVSFLITEILGRCKSHYKNLSGLNLFTEEGAMLYLDDMISYVLVDNSVVSAVPHDSSLPISRTDGLSDIEEIREFLNRLNDVLELRDEYLTVQDVKCISKGLVQSVHTSVIDVSGCYFETDKYSDGPDVMKEFIHNIVELRDLKVLNFSSCLINHCWEFLNGALQARIQEGQYTFSRLETLNLSFVSLPNDQDRILANVFQSCSSLRHLTLKSCNLIVCKTFANIDLLEYFSHLQNLQSLDISENTFCEKENTYHSGLFTAMMRLPMENLNMSSTKNLHLCEQQFAEDIISLINKTECTLKNLDISNCFHTAFDDQTIRERLWEAVCKQKILSTLDVSYSAIDITVVKTMSGFLPCCTSLTNLELAGSKSFDRECLVELLKPLGKYLPSLEKVNLSFTGVLSPLLEETYPLVSECKNLLLLDMTECRIDQSEKERLLVAWKLCHSRNNGLINDFLCVLSRHVVK